MDYSPLWISIKTASVATAVTFFIGMALAWHLARHKKSSGLLDSLLTLPMVLPPTVVGFFLLVVFGRKGPIGALLHSLRADIIFTWWAAVVAAAVVSFPLMYKTARGGFEQIDQHVLDAARTLGVSEWRIFWQVAVPLAWPSIAAGAVLSFARALGEFGATLMVAGNIPGRTQTIPLAIFFAAEGGDMDRAYLWVGIIFMVSIFSMLLMNYWTSYQRRVLHRTGSESL